MSATPPTIADLGKHIDSDVTLRGWVRHRRKAGGKLCFIELRDGSGSVQVVVKKGQVADEDLETAVGLSLESTIQVTGTVRADERQKGGVELAASKVEVIARAGLDFPIGKKEHGVGFLMDQRHLWLRSSRPWATLRVRAQVIRACRQYLDERGFVNVDAPIFNSAAAEGTATLFPVEYFDDRVYLSQTGQLHMEAAAQAHGKVYCFGPTFRAEKSKTRRHLTEFWMLEPEIAFAHLDDVMEVMEGMIAYTVSHVLETCADELAILERDTTKLESATKAPYPRVSYTEALEILKGTDAEITWGDDFGAPQEDAISKHFDGPVLVHRFPMAIKAFYMQEDPEDSKLALGCDMIAPDGYGEIIGGGERAPSLDYLVRKIEEEKLPQEAYEWYLDLRRFGACPSAGFGMGLERVVSWICGLSHVREAIPFARTMARTKP